MRSYWLTGWLLVVLLACSAVDPRAAMADAPAITTTRHANGKSPALPARPDPADRQFDAVFALCGYTRAQKIEELSAGWSPRSLLLVRTVEWAHLTTDSLNRAAASVLHRGMALRSIVRPGGLAQIRQFAIPAIATPGYPLLPLYQWLQVAFVCILIATLGLAAPVLWLIRRHATPASPDDAH
jgi:hypothetical protein